MASASEAGNGLPPGGGTQNGTRRGSCSSQEEHKLVADLKAEFNGGGRDAVTKDLERLHKVFRLLDKLSLSSWKVAKPKDLEYLSSADMSNLCRGLNPGQRFDMSQAVKDDWLLHLCLVYVFGKHQSKGAGNEHAVKYLENVRHLVICLTAEEILGTFRRFEEKARPIKCRSAFSSKVTGQSKGTVSVMTILSEALMKGFLDTIQPKSIRKEDWLRTLIRITHLYLAAPESHATASIRSNLWRKLFEGLDVVELAWPRVVKILEEELAVCQPSFDLNDKLYFNVFLMDSIFIKYAIDDLPSILEVLRGLGRYSSQDHSLVPDFLSRMHDQIAPQLANPDVPLAKFCLKNDIETFSHLVCEFLCEVLESGERQRGTTARPGRRVQLAQSPVHDEELRPTFACSDATQAGAHGKPCIVKLDPRVAEEIERWICTVLNSPWLVVMFGKTEWLDIIDILSNTQHACIQGLIMREVNKQLMAALNSSRIDLQFFFSTAIRFKVFPTVLNKFGDKFRQATSEPFVEFVKSVAKRETNIGKLKPEEKARIHGFLADKEKDKKMFQQIMIGFREEISYLDEFEGCVAGSSLPDEEQVSSQEERYVRELNIEKEARKQEQLAMAKERQEMQEEIKIIKEEAKQSEERQVQEHKDALNEVHRDNARKSIEWQKEIEAMHKEELVALHDKHAAHREEMAEKLTKMEVAHRLELEKQNDAIVQQMQQKMETFEQKHRDYVDKTQRQIEELNERHADEKEKIHATYDEFRANMKKQCSNLAACMSDHEAEKERMKEEMEQLDHLLQTTQAKTVALWKIDWGKIRDRPKPELKPVKLSSGTACLISYTLGGCLVQGKQLHATLMGQCKMQFYNDMELASRHRHPHLVQFIGGVVRANCRPLILTEFIDSNCSLRHVLQSTVSDDDLHLISIQLASALCFLADSGPEPIVHGNITSSNVMLCGTPGNYQAKLCDLASARWWKVTSEKGYEAPEAADQQLTVKADSFSFGILLLEMYAKPWSAHLGNPHQCLQKLERPLLCDLVERCIDDDPANRPCAGELLSTLELDLPNKLE